MRRSVFFAVAVAFSIHVAVSAQAPHGGASARPQPGPNMNAAAGIVADPLDPAAFVKSDLLLQRQNETVIAASSRNPDHLLAAANDYRFVDFPNDPHFGEQGFIARLIARLLGRPTPRIRAANAVGGWTGVYRSCDRGGRWVGGALPGSPLDNSPASLTSPLKQLSNSAPQGAHAETTDPILVAGPAGRMHVVVLGFIRFPNGTVGDSRLYYASYTDRNNHEGGSCFSYDYMAEIDHAGRHATTSAPAPFMDKPSMAVDKDGTLFVSYTVFTDGNNSKIVVARSSDAGASWTRTEPLLAAGFLRNHGTTTVVDPLTNDVYVAWRVFYDNWPLMVISRSPNRGATFLPPSPISHLSPTKNVQQIVKQLKSDRLQPFDQFTSAVGAPPGARALGFPHMVAGVVNGQTRLFAVWTERADVNPASPTFGQPSATGSPRVMLSISQDGLSWTPRRAIDAGPRTESSLQTGPARPSGPQIQPTSSISGTTNPSLLVAYYEAREELQQPFENNFIVGAERQMDVRVARVNPVTGNLLAPSAQVSQYDVKTNSIGEGELAERLPGSGTPDRAVNLSNLNMYGSGKSPFIGDYLSLASSSVFEWAGNAWRLAIDPSSALAMWTDSRNAKFPIDPATQKPDVGGDWTAYTPLKPAFPALPPSECGSAGMRDANPYFAEIAGVVAGSPQNFKPLTVQRAFVAYVANRTPDDRSFRLQIVDDEAAGLDASFDQFVFGAAADVREVLIFGNSMNVQTVWVQPHLGNPTASLRIRAEELVGPGGDVKPNGYKATIVLNQDPNNDALTPIPNLVPGFENDPNAQIDKSELHNPQISSPQISTFNIKAPQISSPQISTPQISTPQISTPQISTPQISTPQISTPQISTPQISTPQISTPQISSIGEGDNGTDVVYTVNNIGNTWTAYNVMFNVPNVDELLTSGAYQFQVLVTRTSLTPAMIQTAAGCVPAAAPNVQVLANIPVPATAVPQISTVRNPDLATPQIATPQIATFALAPLGGASGQNAGDPGIVDQYGVILPDEVKITLRAIRLRELAATDPVFEPTGVLVKLQSQSTNVIQGVPQPAGSQPEVVGTPSGAFIRQPSDAIPNVAIFPSVRVIARDSTGAVLPGANITLNLSSNPGDANLTGNTATAGVDGIAEFPALAVSQAGVGYVLEAFVGATSLGTSVPFTIGGPMTFVVTSLADSGPGTLRQAILDSNTNAGALDTIAFDIDDVPPTISLTTVLPPITDPVHIDGTTQGLFGEGNIVQVSPSAPIGGSAGLDVTAGGAGTTIRGLSITGWSGHGIRLTGGSNVVVGNLIGLTRTGAAAPNGEGVFVDGSSNNVIGGNTAALRNVISHNAGHGVHISGGFDAQGNQVLGNYIGTDRFANAAAANGGSGINVVARFSIIGGAAAGQGNVISGNGQNGIAISQDDSDTTIKGNRIGTNGAGTAAIPNLANGIAINDTEFNVIGGSLAGEGNLISGNGAHGIVLSGDASASTIAGNIIGLDVTGTTALGNGADGLRIQATFSTTVGGTTAAERNIISGNVGNGISLDDARSNVIAGNYIGTDITGALDRGNGLNGVYLLTGSETNLIGGTDPGAKNVISGNFDAGVWIDVTSTDNDVQGNFIGTNATGTAAISNGHNSGPPAFDLVGSGVRVDGPANRIGSGAANGGNLISGNGTGISVSGAAATNTAIRGNRIGLNAAGTGTIGLQRFGIFSGAAPGTFIGGGGAGDRNVVAGNTVTGIYLVGGTAILQGNYIGTNETGTGALGNGLIGVRVESGAVATILGNVISGNSGTAVTFDTSNNNLSNNRIGVAADDSPLGNGSGVSIGGSNNLLFGNTIANNGSTGVSVSGGGNRLEENLIYDNGTLGIDLGGDGVTANDPADGDAGPNELQNYPVISIASPDGLVLFSLDSTPSTTFLLQFFLSPACDASGFGEGRTFVGTRAATTGAGGPSNFSVNLGPLPNGSALVAVAIDPVGNTSEFSGCKIVAPTEPEPEGEVSSGSLRSGFEPLERVRREGIGRLGRTANLQK